MLPMPNFLPNQSPVVRWNSRLACPRCSHGLDLDSNEIRCPRCDTAWPVDGGIPRFHADATYWGELPPNDAMLFIDEARARGWRQAVEARFGEKPDMIITFCDWQRASWLSLLGLGSSASALDIGSGYGAITHSLARTVKEVYSVEAVRQRIDFTQVRLAQEGLDNVCLIQASALSLPFTPAMFDLIVVNGVLEWVGEWAISGDPRSVQVDFISSLNRLLKPDGVLVIGIENRIGYGALRGSIDHSGLPYTSLLPRSLASLALRRWRPPHDRTTINPRGEYRTYTYSRRGYRKLLADSGFLSADFYWAYPSYNQPYYVIPLRRHLVREKYRATLRYARDVAPKGYRRWVKALLRKVGLPVPLVPEFLILARKDRGSAEDARTRLWAAITAGAKEWKQPQNPIFDVTTHPFGEKNLIRVYNGGTTPSVIVKSSTPTPESKTTIQTEYDNLSLIHRRLQKVAKPVFSVAQPLGSAEVGSMLYTTESVVEGVEFSQELLSRPSPLVVDTVRSSVSHCIRIAVQIAKLLEGETSVQAVDPEMAELPEEMQKDSSIFRIWQRAGSLSDSTNRSIVQHGDFTIYNIFWEKRRNQFAVVDWGVLLRGVPPLYDIFSFLITALPAVRWDSSFRGATLTERERQFLTVFFGDGPWASFTKELLLFACEQLGLRPEEVWAMFVQFLVVRCRFYLQWRSQERKHFLRFLTLLAQHENQFVFHRQ